MQLTNQSTVTLVDSMGSDLRVADSARVSFAKQSALDENGLLKLSDQKLIRYLARNQHWTPFAHVMTTVRISCPVFVARQWFRHTIGVARNEVSRRYVDDAPVFYLPDIIRTRPDGSIKQGSGGEHPDSEYWRARMASIYQDADALYENMIAADVAPEQARIVLPLAHMTEFYETASLAFYGRVLGLRLDSHAQEEIRDLAQKISTTINPIAPVSLAALGENSWISANSVFAAGNPSSAA